MEAYNKLCKELILEHVKEVQEWDKTKRRNEILNELLDDSQNVFGNIDGSRTCNTYEAQKFIDESGAIWDDEIRELFTDIEDGYFEKTLARGPEVLDVVILELLYPQVVYEIMGASK